MERCATAPLQDLAHRLVKVAAEPADDSTVMEQLPAPGSGSARDRSLDEASAFFDLDQIPPAPPSRAPSMPPPPPHGGGTATMVAVAPSLPQVAPPVPRPANTPAANPFATMLNDPTPTGVQRPSKKKSNRGKRFLTWFLVLTVIGGAAAAAWIYGSDLMTLATGDEVIDEPELANVFPTPTAAAPTVRTATFVVDQPAGAVGPRNFQVTVDFETTIAEVVVDGGTQPDLEMLTLFNDAVARREGSVVWYQLPRGTFPLGVDQGRTRWVRTVDELFPPSIRQWASVERATESDLDGEPMTRLLVSIDPARLAIAPPAAAAVPSTAAPVDSAPVDSAPVGSAPGAEATPSDAPAAAPPAAAPAEEGAKPGPAPAPTLPPGLTLTTTPNGAVTGPVSIELWTDDAGVIRKLILPPELGGETVTVLAYSADPWQPAFPTAEQVQPITADALFEFAR